LQLSCGIAALFMLLAIPVAAMAVDINPAEQAEVNRINTYRKSHGLGNLLIDVKLTKAAEWMSADMARYNYFSHTDRLGRDPFDRIALYGYPSDTWRGENLAAGNEGYEDTFQQWKNSPAHNENMLEGHYTAIGIARVYDPNSTYGYYWSTDFGSEVNQKWQSPKEVAQFTAFKKHVRKQFPTVKKRAWLKRRIARCNRTKSASQRRSLHCGYYARAGKALRIK
jgi:hypothetical protein